MVINSKDGLFLQNGYFHCRQDETVGMILNRTDVNVPLNEPDEQPDTIGTSNIEEQTSSTMDTTSTVYSAGVATIFNDEGLYLVWNSWHTIHIIILVIAFYWKFLSVWYLYAESKQEQIFHVVSSCVSIL